MKQDSYKTTKRFDPLLFNGLGSERDRKWNHILYSVMFDIGAILIAMSIYLLYGILSEWYDNSLIFFISYFVITFIFAMYCVLWLYIHILLFKNGLANKHINKNNPILVCKYQGSFKNYCVWTLGFLYIFIIYSIAIVLSVFAPTFVIIVLFHIFMSKPFLLKRILLFKEYVILEYKIFGNIKLSREGLALITLPRRNHGLSISPLAFVRPVFFNNKYVIPYFCIRFNPFGMSNVNTLMQELDSQRGYNAEKIIAINQRPYIGLKRVVVKANDE
ncbi:hypothetical protein CQA53_10070 [Helicobacter didelphidarum]|uniref:Uncharacterized protein n=1 Tax=Helicobacter didelphidarum TaxID=2040648 RepID=A0A3D8I8J5_9HELI|nr:hypothetical protein [Helicobacter didelphidarum]RDU61472.1 hypothetical protein CQA53_10070 [Helicobacter didelphidarum]